VGRRLQGEEMAGALIAGGTAPAVTEPDGVTSGHEVAVVVDDPVVKTLWLSGPDSVGVEAPPTAVRPGATDPEYAWRRLILLPDLLPDRPTRGTTSRHRPSAGNANALLSITLWHRVIPSSSPTKGLRIRRLGVRFPPSAPITSMVSPSRRRSLDVPSYPAEQVYIRTHGPCDGRRRGQT
jgi:hypothetical protein